MQPFCLRLKSVSPHTIGAFGQNMLSVGPDKSIDAMDQADTIVIGSPVYWHIICGSVRSPGGLNCSPYDDSVFLFHYLS